MILSGTPLSHEIEFNTGLPTGVVTYSLLGNDGVALVGYDGLTTTPAVSAVSVNITLPAAAHTVATPLFETRTLVWSYNTVDGAVAGRYKYRVEKDIPFSISTDGVRNKLGVLSSDISDNQIDLLKAYSDFLSQYADGSFTAYETSGDRAALVVADAIEATAALTAIPWMQLSVAKKESSGTNTYERFSEIDWELLRASLDKYVQAANDLVTPIDDPTVLPLVFVLASRDDPFTGETA